MRLVVAGVGVLAACAGGAMGACADETVVAVYGGSGEGGGHYGGSDGWGGAYLGGSPPYVPDCFDERASVELNPAIIGSARR